MNVLSKLKCVPELRHAWRPQTKGDSRILLSWNVKQVRGQLHDKMSKHNFCVSSMQRSLGVLTVHVDVSPKNASENWGSWSALEAFSVPKSEVIRDVLAICYVFIGLQTYIISFFLSSYPDPTPLILHRLHRTASFLSPYPLSPQSSIPVWTI